jgi:pilus assembly protein Flp/PilA
VRGLIGLGARFFQDDGGATSIEYAIIAGSLSIVILVAVTSTGSTLVTLYTSVSDGLTSLK